MVAKISIPVTSEASIINSFQEGMMQSKLVLKETHILSIRVGIQDETYVPFIMNTFPKVINNILV
jgi:hypothetical protein